MTTARQGKQACKCRVSRWAGLRGGRGTDCGGGCDGGVPPGAACAQDERGPMRQARYPSRRSVVAIKFDSSATVDIGGAPVDGGSLSLSDGTTPALRSEYFLTPAISAAVNFGIPMKTTIRGEGTLAPAGEAGRVEYGIGAAMLRYHVDTGSALSPYVGVGRGPFVHFRYHRWRLDQFRRRQRLGAGVPGRRRCRLGQHIGLFANVSYAPLKTERARRNLHRAGRGACHAEPHSHPGRGSLQLLGQTPPFPAADAAGKGEGPIRLPAPAPAS